MPERTQAAADHEADHAGRKPAPEVQAFAGLEGEYAGTSLFLDSLKLLAGDPRAGGSPLGGPNVPPGRRLANARGIARIHGNQHLGRVIARLADGAPKVVQRDDSAPGGGPPAGVVSTSEALKARAQEALKNVYGSIKSEITGKVEVLDDATLRQRFDEMQMRRKSTNPRTQQPWKMGDSVNVFPQLFGFADRDNGVVNVLDAPAGGGGEQLSTTIHELLHVNAAGDWAGTMGATFDEGQTEIMAMKVCASQRIAITPSYAGQRGRTAQLAEMVGADMLEQAYFGGASTVVAVFDILRGDGKWAELKRAMADGDGAKFDRIIKAPHTSSWAKEKILIIQDLLSWWVDDMDIAKIEAICRTASAEDLKAIASAVLDQVDDLMNFGHRARVRIALRQ